jgi:long-chain acyl-CoA synthetase
MLYLRCLETLHRFAQRPAIHHGGEVILFSDLASAIATRPVAHSPVIARSGEPSFFIDILQAWRDGQAVIPVEKDAPEPLLHRPPGADIRLVKYTPGASGVPRGIFLNAGQIIADADQIVATMKLTPDVPNLAVVSMAHSYGFSNLVLPLLLHGIPLHLVPVPFPRVVEEACRLHEAITVPAVPSMWRAWHRSGILRTTPIHLALSAGAPLALDLEIAVLHDAGLKIHNFYGASECGGIAYDATTGPRPSGDLLGTPLHGVEVSLQANGRLMVTSTAVATAYDAPRADDLLGAGSYLTRDVCSLDEMGNLYLTKTTGSAINVAGRKVSPAKVEAAIMASGCVRRVRVFGIPSSDPERFEEIAAEVEVLPGASLDQMKSTLSSRLQIWETPRHWR